MTLCPSCTFLNRPGLNFCEVCSTSLKDQHDKVAVESNVNRKRAKETVTTISNSDREWEAIVQLSGNTKSELKAFQFDNDNDQNNNNNNDNNNFNSIASTEGIIELISKQLTKEKTKYKICSPCPHITQSGFEGSHWSCGYRNIQMLCHTLIQQSEYRNVLFNKNGDIPDVYGIQSWIEKAWKAGFDPMGSEQLGGYLIGRDIWIGATECVTLLRYFGIRCKVVQFTCFRGGDKNNNKSQSSSSSSSITTTSSSSSNNSNVDGQRSGIQRYFGQSDSYNDQIHLNTSTAQTFSSSNNNSNNSNKALTKGSYDEDDPNFDWNSYIQANSNSDNNNNNSSNVNSNSNNQAIVNSSANSSSSSSNNNRTILNLMSDNEDDGEDNDYDSDYQPKSSSSSTSNCRTSGRKRMPVKTYDAASDTTNTNTNNTGNGKKNYNNTNNNNSRKSISQYMTKNDTEIGKAIAQWVKEYFTDCYDVEKRKCVPPLYFQHEGHSRTIVGYEETSEKFNLLIFDPSSSGVKLKANLLNNRPAWKMQLKRGLGTLNRKAFQVVKISPGLMTMQEREASKYIDTEEISV